MPILTHGGVGEEDVASAITAVATVDEADFGCAPRHRADAAHDESTLGGDSIGLTCHDDKLPQRRKEHTDADGYEGDKEGTRADFKPNRKL